MKQQHGLSDCQVSVVYARELLWPKGPFFPNFDPIDWPIVQTTIMPAHASMQDMTQFFNRGFEGKEPVNRRVGKADWQPVVFRADRRVLRITLVQAIALGATL